MPWSLLAAALLTLEVLSRFAMTRVLFKTLGLVFVLLEVGAGRLVRAVIKPEFELLGDCHRCGECCEQIVSDPPSFIKNTRLLRLYLLFHRVTHRFTATHRGPNGEVIFRCGHLLTDGRCGIYHFRPLLCRNYPRVPQMGRPRLLPNCSYQYAPRVVAQMQSRRSLPIVNAHVAVHHPSRSEPSEHRPEDFHQVDIFQESTHD